MSSQCIWNGILRRFRINGSYSHLNHEQRTIGILHRILTRTSALTFFEKFFCMPLFPVVWISHKIFFRSKIINPAKADFTSGRRPLSTQYVALFDSYQCGRESRFISVFKYVLLMKHLTSVLNVSVQACKCLDDICN